MKAELTKKNKDKKRSFKVIHNYYPHYCYKKHSLKFTLTFSIASLKDFLTYLRLLSSFAIKLSSLKL